MLAFLPTLKSALSVSSGHRIYRSLANKDSPATTRTPSGIMRTPAGLAAPDLRYGLAGAPSPAALPTTAAMSAMGPAEEAQPQYGRVVYTEDALSAMTLKQLKDICRSRELVIGGKKQELCQRILESQLGPYPNKAAGP